MMSDVSYSKYSKHSDDRDWSEAFHIFKQDLGLLVSKIKPLVEYRMIGFWGCGDD